MCSYSENRRSVLLDLNPLVFCNIAIAAAAQKASRHLIAFRLRPIKPCRSGYGQEQLAGQSIWFVWDDT